MISETQLVKLVALKEDGGGYMVLVFKNIETDEYMMCTRLPNWNTSVPELYSKGYLQVREFIAGEDKWYNIHSGESIPFKYTGIYFWDFVPFLEKIDKNNYELD